MHIVVIAMYMVLSVHCSSTLHSGWSRLLEKRSFLSRAECAFLRRSKALIIDLLLEATHAERVLWRSSAAMLAEEGMGSGPHAAAADTDNEACFFTSQRCLPLTSGLSARARSTSRDMLAREVLCCQGSPA